jgi:hypothetical protein
MNCSESLVNKYVYLFLFPSSGRRNFQFGEYTLTDILDIIYRSIFIYNDVSETELSPSSGKKLNLLGPIDRDSHLGRRFK